MPPVSSPLAASRRARLLRWALVLALLGATLGAGGQAPRAEGPPDAPTRAQVVPREAERHPKMDSAVASLAQLGGPTQQALAQERAAATGLRLEGGRLQVRLSVRSAEAATAAVLALGGAVTKRSHDGALLQAWLPLAALEPLAAHPEVTMIRRPALAHALDDGLRAAGLLSGGVAASGADVWQAAGHRGQNVKIGIVDIGFLGYSSLLGSELPPSVSARNFVDGQSDAQVDGSSAHGTACAEIIHDMAPQATLYLAKIATDLDLYEAADWLRAQGVQIISTSLNWFNLSPGDGTGPLAALAAQLEAAGILWVASAGNMRQTHWGGSWLDVNENGELDFAPAVDRNILYWNGDYTIPSGVCFDVYIRWSDWAAVNQDYDLVMFRWTNYFEWEPIASSTDFQSGAPGQTPTEQLLGCTFLEPTYYSLGIQRRSGDAPVHFEVFVAGASHLFHSTPVRSLALPGDAAAVLAVGAVDVAAPYGQRPYSSEGPTNGPGGVASGGQPKPDLAAYDGVNTASWGEFLGASASAPHVAGAAAILHSAYPTWSMRQVRDDLEARALDLGSPGRDNQYGEGRLHLGWPQGRIWLPLIGR